ncbi:MAG: FAD synthase [Thaumarchaeota archaeon]|nr:FAD synthase [Nitrososphaerota archaeon]
MNNKRVLAAIFSQGLVGKKPTVVSVSEALGVDKQYVWKKVKHLVEAGSVKSGKDGLALTPGGREAIRVVFIGGGFEVIHIGHLYTVESAKALGDVLVVSVARDSTIRRRKKREPVAGEKERVRLLSALRAVDAAILGVEGDIYETLSKVRPDVVALGYDQYHGEADIKRQAAKRGLKVKVVRLDSPVPGVKTSSLLGKY